MLHSAAAASGTAEDEAQSDVSTPQTLAGRQAGTLPAALSGAVGGMCMCVHVTGTVGMSLHIFTCTYINKNILSKYMYIVFFMEYL